MGIVMPAILAIIAALWLTGWVLNNCTNSEQRAIERITRNALEAECRKNPGWSKCAELNR